MGDVDNRLKDGTGTLPVGLIASIQQLSEACMMYGLRLETIRVTREGAWPSPRVLEVLQVAAPSGMVTLERGQ